MNSEALLQSLLQLCGGSIKLTLDRVAQLLEAVGNPHHHLPPTIHVAGTNGKGSTIAYLRAMYEAEGYRVHVYTSPHLVRFHERIVLAGHEISDAYLSELLTRITPLVQQYQVTYFEVITVLAFMAFHENPADALLLEVGLGGRLDVTNVIPQKIAAVIAPIGYDHMEFLGNTLALIAAEKAAIMHAKCPAILAPQTPEAATTLLNHAQTTGAIPIQYGVDWDVVAHDSGGEITLQGHRFHIPKPALLGSHQLSNAALAAVTAMQCRHVLPITEASIARGVTEARWPGRLQRLTYGPFVESWQHKGDVYLDGGHNSHAAQAIATHFKGQSITVLLAMMARKDVEEFLRIIAPITAFLIVMAVPNHEAESADATYLANIAKKVGISVIHQASNVENAQTLLAQCDSATLLATGSLYFAGEILKNHG
jgi:dihydrofolate synthase/folylpolyglutamate synthase